MTLANLKPSLRPLINAISPNPGKQAQLMRVTPAFCAPSAARDAQLREWEDQEIAALVLQFLTQPLTHSEQIPNLKKILQCPLVADFPICDQSEILTLRSLDFDAVLTPLPQGKSAVLSDFFREAEAVNMSLIFKIKTNAEAQAVSAHKPRFVFLENTTTNDIWPRDTWKIGNANLANAERLKAICTDFTIVS